MTVRGWSHWTVAQLEAEQARWREALDLRERRRAQEQKLLNAARLDGRTDEVALRVPRLKGEDGMVNDAQFYLEVLAEEIEWRQKIAEGGASAF